MTLSAAVAVATAFLGTFVVLGGAVVLVVRTQLGRTSEISPHRLADLEQQVAALKLAVDGLPPLWKHERELAEEANASAKKRNAAARAALSSARRARGDDDDDDEDDEGEDPDVLRLDAGVGRASGMHALPSDVEGDSAEDLTRRAVAAGWTPFL